MKLLCPGLEGLQLRDAGLDQEEIKMLSRPSFSSQVRLLIAIELKLGESRANVFPRQVSRNVLAK